MCVDLILRCDYEVILVFPFERNIRFLILSGDLSNLGQQEAYARKFFCENFFGPAEVKVDYEGEHFDFSL